MRNLVISGNVGTVALRNITFSITPKPVETVATMVSGKTVVDTRGMRNVLTTPTVWLDGDNLSTLRQMISAERILSVTYPDTDGNDTTEKMLFTQPTYRAFKYDDEGVTCYYGITLTAEGTQTTAYPYSADVPDDNLDEAYGLILDAEYGSDDSDE